MKKLLCLLLAVFCLLLSPLSMTAFAQGGSNVSAYFHATISTESNTVTNGQYVSFNVDYTLDYQAIHEDDYVVVSIPNELRLLNFSLDPMHFKNKVQQPDGSWRLIFNDLSNIGLAGSFSINLTAQNTSTSAVDATVYVGNTSYTIKITGLTPPGPGGGTTKAIEKSAWDNDVNIYWGDYDYSTGSDVDATEQGVYDPSHDTTAYFRIYVNNAEQEMWNITVTDDLNLPSGVTYNNDLHITDAAGVSYTNRSIGNHIEVFFGHVSANQNPVIEYSLTIAAGTTRIITNTAFSRYTSITGGTETVSDRYKLKPGFGYSASIGYKEVDKATVSAAPDDQTVTYTITFETDEAFAAGRLVLPDKLNEYVRFLGANCDPGFSASYDPQTHTVTMFNTETIPANAIRKVTIITDFSNVPEGMDVTNTAGTTVHTLKYKGSLELEAIKTVNNEAPGDARFSFQLLDSNGSVLQTKQNDSNGKIVFDKIYYKGKDLGKEFTYQVVESGTVDGYDQDTTVYTVTVIPTDSDNNGILEINPVIKAGDQTVGEIKFNNTRKVGSLKIEKVLTGNDVDSDKEFSFTVSLAPALSGTFSDVNFTNGEASITLKGGESKTIEGLPQRNKLYRNRSGLPW